MPEGRLCWQKGRRIYLQGAVIGEKAPFRAKKAPLLSGGAPYLFRMAPSWANRAPFCIRRGPSPAGRRRYNAFGAKIDPELRYPANIEKD